MHTAGSISVVVNTEIAITGDVTLQVKKNHMKR